jgi:putative DNA primase/helicase
MPETYGPVSGDFKSLPNWLLWRLENKNGKPTKVPYRTDGSMASSTDPATWTDFKQVQHIEPAKTGGIGIVLFAFVNGRWLVGIDLDHCLRHDGTIDPKFSQIIERLKTYTEISPSGTGLHLYLWCGEHPYYWRSPPTKDHPDGKEHYGKKKGTSRYIRDKGTSRSPV